MNHTELETVTRNYKWGEEAFRDAGAATFGYAESFDYDSLVFALVRGVPDEES